MQHEAVCVVSKVGEVALFEQLLQIFRQARNIGCDLCRELIKAATRIKLPRINKEVYLKATVGVSVSLVIEDGFFLFIGWWIDFLSAWFGFFYDMILLGLL